MKLSIISRVALLFIVLLVVSCRPEDDDQRDGLVASSPTPQEQTNEHQSPEEDPSVADPIKTRTVSPPLSTPTDAAQISSTAVQSIAVDTIEITPLPLTTAPLPSVFLPEYKQVYVDTDYGGNGKPGWVRAGDMDKDGDLDIVAGGGNALFIYENNGYAAGWQRYGSLDSTGNIGANGGVLSDVDNDGDLDVVSAKYYDDLGWWENPGGGLSNTSWSFHAFSDEKWFLHDIIAADLDQDGFANEFITNLNSEYWSAKITIKWFRPGANPTEPWLAHEIEEGRKEGSPHGHAGLDVGDINNDGNVDLAFANGWYEAPDDPTGSWTWRQTTDVYGVSNALIRDVDKDTDMDLVITAGHHGQGVYWLENDGKQLSGLWTRHNISAFVGDVTAQHFYQANEAEHLHHPECLDVEDLDSDGDQDTITCDLFFGEDLGEPGWNQEVHNIYIYENQGNGISWSKHTIAPNSYPSHLLQLFDVNKDGLLDIISESAGYSVVSYYEAVWPE